MVHQLKLEQSEWLILPFSTTVGVVIDTDGVYLNEDGHVSESTMKVQDSLYYQDFSYVIKVGRAIVDWRNHLKIQFTQQGFM